MENIDQLRPTMYATMYATIYTTMYAALCTLLLAGSLLAGCSSKPYVDYDTGFDFTGAKNFYIIPTEITHEPLMGPRVANAVSSDLVAKGLAAVPSRSQADIAIRYHVTAEEKPNNSRVSIGLGTGSYGRGGGASVGGSVSKPIGGDMLLYNTVQIDMFAGDSDRLIWRSSDSFEIKGVDAQKKADATERLVIRVLANFPPATAGTIDAVKTDSR
jgi:hypothetical protein